MLGALNSAAFAAGRPRAAQGFAEPRGAGPARRALSREGSVVQYRIVHGPRAIPRANPRARSRSSLDQGGALPAWIHSPRSKRRCDQIGKKSRKDPQKGNCVLQDSLN